MSVNIASPPPTLVMIFNDQGAPDMVREIIERRHAFARYETMTTRDEADEAAYVLAIWCETASRSELQDLVVGRLPDYIRARLFPASRWLKLQR